MQTGTSSYIIKKDGRKAASQIDLLIDRADRVINLCEIKFANKEFVIDKSYEEKLRQRSDIIQELTNNKKNIHLTFITTFGLHKNVYANRVQNSLTMSDLFLI